MGTHNEGAVSAINKDLIVDMRLAFHLFVVCVDVFFAFNWDGWAENIINQEAFGIFKWHSTEYCVWVHWCNTRGWTRETDNQAPYSFDDFA